MRFRLVAALLVSAAPLPLLAATVEPPPKVTSPLGAYLAASTAERAYDLSNAYAFMGQALAADPKDLELLRRTLDLAISEGRMADATALAERLAAVEQAQPNAQILLATNEIRQGKLDQADARLRGLPRIGLGNLVVPLMRGWIAAGRRNLEMAQGQMAPLGEIPAVVLLRDFHTAMIADYLGDNAKAEAAYTSMLASEQVPSWRTVERAGAFYERIGKPELARAAYESIQKRTGDTLLTAPALQRLRQKVQPERAIVSVSDGLAEAFFDIASILQREQPAGLAALSYTRMALDLKPDFVSANMLLADILEAEERPAAALAAYQTVPKTSPFNWVARQRIAVIKDQLGDLDGAVAELRTMASERPEREDPMQRIGDLYRAKERWSDAAAAYDEAVKRLSQPPEPGDWSLFFSRGIVNERAGRTDQAIGDLGKALELQPDQPYVLNYLGYTWLEQRKNYEKARGMIERAVALRPRDASIRDSLGWAFYRQGDFDHAVGHLEAAIVLKPTDPTINDHLGDAYFKVGRTREARYQWERAIKLDPEPDAKAALVKKLAGDTSVVAP